MKTWQLCLVRTHVRPLLASVLSLRDMLGAGGGHWDVAEVLPLPLANWLEVRSRPVAVDGLD